MQSLKHEELIYKDRHPTMGDLVCETQDNRFIGDLMDVRSEKNQARLETAQEARPPSVDQTTGWAGHD